MSRKHYSRICDHCGKHYVGEGKRFCSRECYNTKRNPNPNTCSRCGKIIPSWRKYCSLSCSATRTPDQNFWPNVNITDLFGCWEWQATKNKRGYGKISFGNKIILTHRYSWFLHYGKIPENLQINHKCHNPSCVNPAHLYLGTQQDNMNDKVRANRQQPLIGESNPSAKLTEIQVIEIIKLLKTDMTQQEIADKFSINKRTISKINTGHKWKHIPR